MISFPATYRLQNVLSIDVACGAMVNAAFFAHVFNAELYSIDLAVLGLTVWIIYTIDHLVDAYQLKENASSLRHMFHVRNFQKIILAAFIAGITDLILISFLRTPLLVGGCVLSSIIVIYLLFQRWLYSFKEIVAALLYCTGVLLPVVAIGQNVDLTPSIFLMVTFFITALINLLLFSWFDLKHDLSSSQVSFVTVFGKSESRRVIVILFAVQALLLLCDFFLGNYGVESTVLLVMNGILFHLFINYARYIRKDLYRLIGDFIFLVPLLYLWLYGF